MASKESEPLAAASEVASATGGEGASATGGEGASATGSETKPDKPTPGPVGELITLANSYYLFPTESYNGSE